MHRIGLLSSLAVALVLSITPAPAAPLGPDGAGSSIPGKIVWLDLASENPASARVFYAAVFGWKFRDAAGAPAAYTLIENDSGKVAGMFHQQRPAGARVGALWLALISVRDAEQAARLVRERGGQV